MSRLPIVAGNWKMNGTLAQTRSLVQMLLSSLREVDGVEIVVCPPHTALSEAAGLLQGKQILLGAQDVHWEPQGAYTGAISVPMLKELGCRYCIVGHSERRQHFGETDEVVARKFVALLRAGMRPILCVGETLDQRRAGKTWAVVETQLRVALEAVEESRAAEVVIAYEPVWAIGTGQNAAPDQAQEVHAAIRAWLRERFGLPAAQAIRIQYGGSVKPDNAPALMEQPDADGALVGGASLDSESFTAIAKAACRSKGGERCSTA